MPWYHIAILALAGMLLFIFFFKRSIRLEEEKGEQREEEYDQSLLSIKKT